MPFGLVFTPDIVKKIAIMFQRHSWHIAGG